MHKLEIPSGCGGFILDASTVNHKVYCGDYACNNTAKIYKIYCNKDCAFIIKQEVV